MNTFFLLLILLIVPSTNTLSLNVSRRAFVVTTLTLSGPSQSLADTSVIAPIQEAKDTLQTLLDNWERAIIDCTFADVPRELLETKNKEQLLEKAKVSALFDKSASVVSCKTTNKKVRDYIGRTGIGPVVGLDKKLKKALDVVNPDYLEEYVQLTEDIQESLSKADSLSYTAGVSDFNAINNFDESEKEKVLEDRKSNLGQARSAIETAVKQLNQVIELLKR